MNENSVQRRKKSQNKRSSNDDEIIAKTKRKQRLSTSSKAASPIRMCALLIIGLTILFILSKLLLRNIHIEHTNVPINLPKLVNVNRSISDRFWGTYR